MMFFDQKKQKFIYNNKKTVHLTMIDFKIIRDLAFSINRNKVKDLTTIKDIKSEGKKVTQLYDGLLSGKYNSDEEAAHDLYGKDETYPSYRRLRRRLLDLLINTSLFIDVSLPKFTDQARAFHSCYRGFAIANILMFHDNANTASYILKNLLEQSIRHEFTNITTEILRILKNQAISQQMSMAEVKKYSRLSREYEEKRYWEIKARDVYEQLLEGFITGRVSKVIITEALEQEYKKFLSLTPEVNTTNYYYVVHNIGVIIHLQKSEVKEALDIAANTYDLLEKRENALKGQLLQFATVELSCYTHLKIFGTDDVSRAIERCNSKITIGSSTWFKVNELIVHYHIYAEEYEKAIQLYKELVSHPRYSLVPETTKETWRMYQGYFHLLNKLRAINDDLIQQVAPIDVDMFEYDFKNLSSVKAGMNIPVLMLPIFFKTLAGEFEAHGRSKESLRKYVDRHLNKRKNIRSVTMIKLLVALDEYPYQPKPTKRTIDRLLTVFKETPIELSEQSAAIEIVPYEKLWELMLRYRRIYL